MQPKSEIHAPSRRPVGHPFKRQKGDDKMQINFPKETILSGRVHAYSLNSFPRIRSLIYGGYSSIKENGFSQVRAVASKSQSLPNFLKLHEHDLLDLEETKEFFIDLVALERSGELAQVCAGYEELGLSYMESLTAEVLSKVLCYREGLEGKSLELPAFIDEQWVSSPYTIHMLTLGEDLPLVVLLPEHPSAPLWMVPRGTSPWFGLRRGVFESLAADVSQVEGIDISVTDKGHDWLAAGSQSKNPLCFAGHSLGGALAVHMGLQAAHLKPTVYTFGAPGVGEPTAKLYGQLEEPLSIFQFSTEGDIIPSAGLYLLGKHLAVELGRDKKRLIRPPFEKHLVIALNQSHRLKEVDVPQEEGTLTRRIMETWVRARVLKKIYQMSSGVKK